MRNLVMIRGDQLLVAEGNSRFLGGAAHQAPDNIFRAKQIQVQAGDQFYLYTDGIENQPDASNNPNITFGGYQLKDVLFVNRKLPMKQQREKIWDALYEWRDGQPHTDDILLAGLRF
jgi:serine phosphatase RsbU (regulator of sigma subunit)